MRISTSTTLTVFLSPGQCACNLACSVRIFLRPERSVFLRNRFNPWMLICHQRLFSCNIYLAVCSSCGCSLQSASLHIDNGHIPWIEWSGANRTAISLSVVANDLRTADRTFLDWPNRVGRSTLRQFPTNSIELRIGYTTGD